MIGFTQLGGSGFEVIWSLLSSLLFLVIMVGAVVLLVRMARHDQRSHPSASALAILEERYARGEIDRSEFLERRAVLVDERQRSPQL
jgi:putative membrane protein